MNFVYGNHLVGDMAKVCKYYNIWHLWKAYINEIRWIGVKVVHLSESDMRVVEYFTDILGMDISRSYTVVPSSLTNQTEDDGVKEGRAFYLMIKIYADGALTQVFGKLAEGEYRVYGFL